jgi:hypothetical protein
MYADLVEQQTATTGTSSYVVSGSVTGRRTFAQGYSADATDVPYVVTDDAGNFECGIGTWTVATLTLARTIILASSNANAAVDWAAGTKRIYVSPHAGMMPRPAKNNFTATTLPATSDNASTGYGVGSRWVANISGTYREFWLTHFSGSNAIWTENAQIQNGNVAGSEALIFGGLKLYGTGDLRSGDPNNANLVGLSINGGSDSNGGTYNFADGYVGLTLSAHTTDATATNMTVGGVAFSHYEGMYVEDNGALAFTALVSASDGAGERATWKVEGSLYADGSSVVTVDLDTATALFQSAGATAWDVATVAPGAANAATLQVTGAAATDIMWSAIITACGCSKY